MNKKIEISTFNQIRSLLRVIINSISKDYETIIKLYNNEASNFIDTEDLLLELDIISKKDQVMQINPKFDGIIKRSINDDIFLKSFLLKRIFNSVNVYSKEISSYLNHFSIDSENRFTFIPSIEQNIQYSSIRNLLTELDFVDYIDSNKAYIIAEKNILLFQNYIKGRKLTPSELSYLLKKQLEIGIAAEIEIIKYERNRLSEYPDLHGKIEHTSIINVNAGYDIKSFEIIEPNNQKFADRYIEVKAVSDFSHKFFLSKNEIEKAEFFKSSYYIYLLPVISTNNFDIESLEIIKDPFNEVLNNDNWVKKVEEYSICKNYKK